MAVISGEAEAVTSQAVEGGIEIINRSPKKVSAVVETDRPALLIRASRYDPNWYVSVSGSPAELLRANYLFQGVRVPAGRHEILFEYRPSRIPLLVSIVGRTLFVCCLFLAAVTYRRDSQQT